MPVVFVAASASHKIHAALSYISDLFSKQHPLEWVSLIGTGTKGPAVLVPFTRDLSSFKKATFSNGDLTDLLKLPGRAVLEEWEGGLPPHQCFHVVVLLDGSFGDFNEPVDPSFESAVVHVVHIPSSESENCSRLRLLCSRHGGTYVHVLSQEEANASGNQDAVRAHIDLLFASRLGPFHGTLCFGNVTETVRLHPDPNLALAGGLFGTQGQAFTGSSALPRAVSVVGFLPVQDLPSPPLISRHVVYSEDGYSEEDPPLHGTLLNALVGTSTVAVVALGASRRGVLFSGPLRVNARRALMLGVIDDSFEFPWLGGDLPALSTLLLPREGFSSVPVNPTKSYDRKKKAPLLPLIDDTALQSDFTKIQKLIRGLPQKKGLLESE